jgi:hypothetical protein
LFWLLEGRPERGCSLMLKSPSWKQENHSNTHARLRACSLKPPWRISNDSVGVFPRRKQNFKQVFVPLNHPSQFWQGHKNYLHKNWLCGRLHCYRKTSVSLLTVEGLGNKHWWCPLTPARLAAVRLVLFLLGTTSYIFIYMYVYNQPHNAEILFTICM